MYRLLTLLLITCCISWTYGQDFHWTQFQRIPTQLNPARSGDFHGTARLSGIARTQSGSIANKGYNSYGFGIDIPAIKGFRKLDWVGVGLGFMTDQAGQLDFGTQSTAICLSYHFALDQKGRTYITLGAGMESYGRKLGNPGAAEWADNTTTVLTGIDPTQFNRASGYTGGIQLKTHLSDRTVWRIGGRYARIGKVRVNLIQPRRNLPGRLALHTDVEHQTGPKTKLTGALLWEDYGPANIMMIQGMNKWLLNEKQNITFSAGLGYRFGDAAQGLVAIGWGDIDLGIAYDMIFSSQAPEARPLGGLELALTYVLKIYPEPKVDPVIFCPRF